MLGDGSVCQRKLLKDPPKNISIDSKTHKDPISVRPPLFLSLTGIVSLSQNEYSLKHLVDMEMKILTMLDWKLMSVTSVDWSHLLLSFIANVYSDDGSRKEMSHSDLEEVRECTITNLESAMETSLHFAPSLVALAAVIHALLDEHHVHGREIQYSISMHKNIVLDLLPHGMDEVD